jgi:hypothetical protein
MTDAELAWIFACAYCFGGGFLLGIMWPRLFGGMAK